MDVKAYGVLTDRGDGFSLAVVLSVEFNPPIEIALGFTLNGVGGIIGLDVRVDTDVLRGQLRSGVLERLLFPPDPIAAAPAILETLATVFPPSRGGFVVGPMLSLGWGRPVSFVKLDLAVILALPDPTVILLARLRVAIPGPGRLPSSISRPRSTASSPRRRVLILASLVDSRVVFFSVSGDIGLLTRFGDDATFAISAGGFHPRYDPAARARRHAPDIGRVLAAGRIAVPRRGLCRADHQHRAIRRPGRDRAIPSASPASTAISRSTRSSASAPFGFELDIAAGVGVEVLGFTLVSIDLALHLSGPAPWRVHGTGRVNLPWPLPDPSISFGPDRVGPRRARRGAPTVSPARARRGSALQARGLDPRRLARPVQSPSRCAMSSPAPARSSSTRGRSSGAPRPTVPLDTDITRVGDARVHPGETRVLLGDPLVAGTAGARWSVDQQPFPLGQYLDLSDDAALSAPSFERRAAGLVIDPADLASPAAAPVQADLRVRDVLSRRADAARGSATSSLAVYEPALTLAATSAGRSELRQPSRYDAVREPVTVAPASEVRVATHRVARGRRGDERRAGGLERRRRRAARLRVRGRARCSSSGRGSEPRWPSPSASRTRSTASPLVPAEEIVLGNYTFLPHFRTGAAAGLRTPFTPASPARATLPLTVPVTSGRDDGVATTTL